MHYLTYKYYSFGGHSSSRTPNVEISAVECFLQNPPRVSRLAEVKEVMNSGLRNMNTRRTFLNSKSEIAFASGIS